MSLKPAPLLFAISCSSPGVAAVSQLSPTAGSDRGRDPALPPFPWVFPPNSGVPHIAAQPGVPHASPWAQALVLAPGGSGVGIPGRGASRGRAALPAGIAALSKQETLALC